MLKRCGFEKPKHILILFKKEDIINDTKELHYFNNLINDELYYHICLEEFYYNKELDKHIISYAFAIDSDGNKKSKLLSLRDYIDLLKEYSTRSFTISRIILSRDVVYFNVNFVYEPNKQSLTPSKI